MSHTTYTDNSTPLVVASWLNDVDTVVYTYFGNGVALNSPTKLQVAQGVFSTSVVTGRLVINSAADASDIQPRITIYSDPSNWAYLSYGASTLVAFVVGKTGSNNTLRVGTTSANDGTGTFTTGGVQAAFIDSGTGASLFLRTGNGNNSFEIIQAGAGAANWWGASGQATGITPFLGVRGETNITGVLQGLKGTGTFRINEAVNNTTQFEVLSVPTAARWITVAASIAGNPTLSTTAGSLNIGSPITGALTVKRKTADESVNTTTTLQDDDHLISAIAANEEWTGFIEYIFGNGMATTGVKVGITFPAGSTLRYWATVIGDTSGASLESTTTTSGTALNFPAALFPTGTTASVRINFWVLNGATPGNITAQFTQSTSSATNTTAFKGSFMQATRIA